MQRKYRSSIYELGSPDVLSDEDVNKVKSIKTDACQCPCQIQRSPDNAWSYAKMSENAIDNETVLVKKQIRSTGISVWHFTTYGHDQSCSFKNITPSPALAWKKLSKIEKKVRVSVLISSFSPYTYIQ